MGFKLNCFLFHFLTHQKRIEWISEVINDDDADDAVRCSGNLGMSWEFSDQVKLRVTENNEKDPVETEDNFSEIWCKESDHNTNCSRYSWEGLQEFRKESVGNGNQKKNRYYQEYRVVEMG